MFNEMSDEDKKKHAEILALQCATYLRDIGAKLSLFEILEILIGSFASNAITICNTIGDEHMFLNLLEGMKEAYEQMKANEGAKNE